ncbi:MULTISPECIES: AAA family ATPase [Pacificibacter]|uniref:AAA family ATPase n=1 Tax=Pacificibacter TaxID=1042323 RepID=UPI001C0A618D|nr:MULTISPECIES: MoxR family ATPase [Pacificibacter]MBU2936405.1 MoxR family ATPase [Pacificibacter marinus]MDO6616554.1 MoxR family ATPase [Pacificibacter sp. 1_MG-2023]
MTWTSLQTALADQNYIASDDLAVALHLALSLERPMLLEGAAGVGKTEVARVIAAARDTKLIRLQCYEGLDAAQAIYEWNYQRQLLAIRAGTTSGTENGQEIEQRIFSRDYLLERPLLQAITQDTPPVLLIDEIDRADEEFEAFLLEMLAENQITVPELGTITATTKPIVILTSNGTRDLSDALRRRCLYAYVEYPDRDTELAILQTRCGDVDARLADQIVGFVQKLRKQELEKTPGIAEMLDFAAALMGLGIADLSHDPKALHATLTTLLKTQSDRADITQEVAQRIAGKAA